MSHDTICPRCATRHHPDYRCPDPAADGERAARDEIRRTAQAVEEAAQAGHASAEAAERDAGFDAGEWSGPAHDAQLDTTLDEIAQRHGLTRAQLDTALWFAERDDDGRWHNPVGQTECPDCAETAELLTHDDADYARCRPCWESAWAHGRLHIPEAWETEDGEPLDPPTLRPVESVEPDPGPLSPCCGAPLKADQETGEPLCRRCDAEIL